MRHFHKYFKAYWKLAITSILFVSLEALCDLFQPRLMARLVDNGIANGDLQTVIHVGLIMLGVVALGAVFALTRNILSSYTSQNFGSQLRNDLYAKIQSLTVEDIDRFEGGSLITRMTNDVNQLQNFVNMLMRIFFKAPVMCVGAIIMIATLNMRAVFLVIPIALCVFFIIGVSMKLSYPRFSKMQKALDALNTTMREYLMGIRLVKAFRRFDTEAERFGAANAGLAESSVEAGRVMAVFGPFLQFFSQLGIAGIIFLGARWVDGGVMEVGSVMAFIIYMQQILQSFNMISNILNVIVRVRTSGERIAEVMDARETQTEHARAAQGTEEGRDEERIGIQPQAVPGTHGRTVSKSGQPAVEFNNVTFLYKGATGHPALDGVSFTIPRGASLGIIGSTGSGKTSLSALLLRFYEPTSGQINISGAALNSFPEEELRRKISVVPQTAALFTGTIKSNILWGKPDANDGEVRLAAELACAMDFIAKQRDGLDTVIGQSGVNLSGGQKQRISIARALIRKPDILVLDDCTSALDVLTEARVKQNLTDYAKGMTYLLITQRISTVMSCDLILTLDGGQVAGFGTHEALMRDCEVYRDIYRSQIGFD